MQRIALAAARKHDAERVLQQVEAPLNFHQVAQYYALAAVDVPCWKRLVYVAGSVAIVAFQLLAVLQVGLSMVSPTSRRALARAVTIQVRR